MEQMFIPTNRIGVYPDGSPVVYSPEKAAEKRKEIAERLKTQLEAQGKDTKNLTISYAPELEPENNIDRLPSLERSPDADEVILANKMLCAKITPADVTRGVGELTAIIAALSGLFDVAEGFIDKIVDKFNPKNEAERAMLKSMVVSKVMADVENNREKNIVA